MKFPKCWLQLSRDEEDGDDGDDGQDSYVPEDLVFVT
jgi:hypothetical protein